VRRLAVILALAAACASSAAAGAAVSPACATPTIGMMAPLTGTAGAIGGDQLHWAQFYVSRWNASHKRKFRVVGLDTQLDATQASVGAKQLVANDTVLGMVIGGRSSEITAAAPVLKRAGLGFVSGSATLDSLTNGSLRGYFFRVVPKDSVQAPTAVSFMTSSLGVRPGGAVAVVDDGEAYSVGLADVVQRLLRAGHVTVRRAAVSQTQTDFSTLIAKIPASVRVLYVPWQLPQQAQLLAVQLRAKRPKLTMFGGDGVFDPARFTSSGAYVSFFAPDISTRKSQSGLVTFFRRRWGVTGPFGAPNWVAAQVLVTAIDKACRDGRASRAEVRRLVASTRFHRTILGGPLSFTRNGDVAGARFSVYRIVNGRYVTIR
jgi:ABC-type branched-subunit amino acid transport system substrate-binding protein